MAAAGSGLCQILLVHLVRGTPLDLCWKGQLPLVDHRLPVDVVGGGFCLPLPHDRHNLLLHLGAQERMWVTVRQDHVAGRGMAEPVMNHHPAHPAQR